MIDVVLVKSSIPHIRGEFTPQDRVTFRLDMWTADGKTVIVARGNVNSSEIGDLDAIGQVFAINAAREWLVDTIRACGHSIPNLPLFVFYANENDAFIRDWLATEEWSTQRAVTRLRARKG